MSMVRQVRRVCGHPAGIKIRLVKGQEELLMSERPSIPGEEIGATRFSKHNIKNFYVYIRMTGYDHEAQRSSHSLVLLSTSVRSQSVFLVIGHELV